MAPRRAVTAPAEEGALLWEPSREDRARANITRYLAWLTETRGLAFGSYDELWRWSVTDLEGFWASIWEFFGVVADRPYTRVLAERRTMGARWCPGAELNYAEHALRRRDAPPAVLSKSEGRALSVLTYAELHSRTAAAVAALRRMGIRRGDRVVAFMPNIPETLIAFLAAASLGAIWSSCPPEFGVRSVVDRFRQIEPRVLFAVDGYRYNGAPHDRMDLVAELERELPTLEATVLVPYLHEAPPVGRLRSARMWAELLTTPGHGAFAFEPVPFDHPLWIVYSSGTTGLPKAIVQGHGGILLELLKALSLHLDLGADDRFFWFTTTGWVMWNIMIGGLLLGTTVVLYDRSPGHPDMRTLWRLAEETGMTYFGTSAPYIAACHRAGIEPAKEANLNALRGLGSTGAPLPPEGFRWVYEHVKGDLLLGSISGGTDVCTAFALSCPLLPVRAGEIQCRGLGASEFYRAVEELPEVLDSLVVDPGQLDREGRLLLFVVLRAGVALDDALRSRIKEKLRRDLSPRHVPDEIHVVGEVPYTLNGKRLEVPVKRILAGVPADVAASPDAMRNPESLRFFVALAGTPDPPR